MAVPACNGTVLKRRRNGEVSGELQRVYVTHAEEIEGLINLRTEHLKAGVAEIHRRHMVAVAGAAGMMLQEKDGKLQRLRQENASLRENLCAVGLQNWQLRVEACRSEAMVIALRERLEDLAREVDAAAQEREGVGESGGEDVESGCGEAGEVGRFRCKVCGEREVAVLVLPCRHLSLCAECEVVAGECPCCRQPKRSALNVVLPPVVVDAQPSFCN
ncbi:hypothetical protein HPP92_013552 [Vanilla planifolia]|uniref:RING-type domain-containing protein n=1 Tax=Vanilla planifolia TaxID=51239 RepID=A0A835UYS1_VANPL|nr:hypothetical protein HPP92_013552 [Vanilla planifolia]